jgi:hypothetical protein
MYCGLTYMPETLATCEDTEPLLLSIDSTAPNFNLFLLECRPRTLPTKKVMLKKYQRKVIEFGFPTHKDNLIQFVSTAAPTFWQTLCRHKSSQSGAPNSSCKLSNKCSFSGLSSKSLSIKLVGSFLESFCGKKRFRGNIL